MALALVGATVVIAAAFAPGAAYATRPDPRVEDLDVQIAVGVDGVESVRIHAERYTPTGPVRGVQVLVPGSTYDHHYFDLDTRGGAVSQARQAAREGWVAIALDRVGTGGSTKPPAASVTTAVQVASIDHFVDAIEGAYRQLPIVLVGHSYGSVVAAGVAAASDKVDALVVTGFMYRHTTPDLDGFPAFVPAATDPVLGRRELPEGYLTTAPGSRAFFYYLPNTDPATLRADERTKATTTAAEAPGFTAELESGAFAGAVRVPVLVVVGEHDYLYQGDDPAAFVPDQRQAFGGAAAVAAVIIPGCGARPRPAPQRAVDDSSHRPLGGRSHGKASRGRMTRPSDPWAAPPTGPTEEPLFRAGSAGSRRRPRRGGRT